MKFPDTTCPSGDSFSKLVKKVRTRGILINRKPLKRNRVLTEEKLHDIGHRLENSRKSLRWLAQQSGGSVGSAWTATKLLHIRPYKITVVPEIKPVDYVNSQNNGFLEQWKSSCPNSTSPLRQTIGVWCAISANRVIEPIFYEGTLDAQRYINEILYPFCVNLAPAE
jgi:hypothetical protein